MFECVENARVCVEGNPKTSLENPFWPATVMRNFPECIAQRLFEVVELLYFRFDWSLCCV